MEERKIYLYPVFERLWHWLQAILIIMLLITGFEIHGVIKIFGFNGARQLHIIFAWSLIGLTIISICWHIWTGTWKQYIPTFRKDKLFPMIRFYTLGIFRGEPHPGKKTREDKLNPLQKVVYFGILFFLLPYQILTGLLYNYFPYWEKWGIIRIFGHTVKTIAILHTAGAFLFLAYVIGHIYLTTTGETLFSYISAMITGWEKFPEE